MSIKEKKVKGFLQEYSVPKYDEEAQFRTIDFIRENHKSVRFRASNKDFIFSQISFIRKRTWILQGFILSFLCMVFYNMSTKVQVDFSQFSLMAILAPLLVIINIDEISRVYNGSILEIECSTKNSLKKVIVTRMIILGVMDSIALISMMIFTSNLVNISIIRVIVYTLTPFNLVCIGSLEFMKHFKGKALNYACTVYSVLVTAILILGRINSLGFYTNSFISFWVAIFVITTIIFVFEIRQITIRLGSFEKVTQGGSIWS